MVAYTPHPNFYCLRDNDYLCPNICHLSFYLYAVLKMIKKIMGICILLLFTFLVGVSTYKFCYFIAEKYFFDKFFFNKSTAHGYWTINQSRLSDFGDRSKDLAIILSDNIQTLGATDDGSYKIAIIGDSYVWGQGIRNDQRFVKILEQKLNRIRSTKIISLAESGDNIFDHYQKYLSAKKYYGSVNLFVFGLLYNDLLFNPPDTSPYHTPEYLQSVSNFGCTGPEIFSSAKNENVYQTFDPNSLNYCSYKQIIKLFPKDNAIYLNLGDMTENSDWPNQQSFNQLIREDLNIFTPFSDKIMSNKHPNKYNVSIKDPHPSALANEIFADVLFKEITTNPKWDFSNDNRPDK
jgi:hypothetical protein